ncbi:MAG TPA: outer membrane protein assembly factor BamE [Stellaceae bacterium]|nr:outer membrane protein assembly factor BamE [Stellaceae bacterium]
MSHRSLFLAAALLTLTLAGCNTPVDPRGNLPTPDELAQIKPGVTDKPTVTRILGSPSSVAAFDDSTWYYISQKTKEVAFFKPELLDQEVIVIDFDKKGVVRDVRRRNLNDRVAVVPNPNATPAPGREFSFFQQLIGNFGRFSGSEAGGQSQPGGGPGGPGHGGGLGMP